MIITDEARPYLVVQKGMLWDLKDQVDQWDAGYRRSIRNQYETIMPHLPEKCWGVLDVGSGLGGINAMISHHYGGVRVCLLDGVSDDPDVIRHNQTFNNMHVAQRFLAANGVREFSYIDPENVRGNMYKILSFPPIPVDLVVSFGAWCFHFPPSLYMEYIKTCCKPGTVFILDVRNDKPSWLMDLNHDLGNGTVIRRAKKFTKWRFVYGRN